MILSTSMVAFAKEAWASPLIELTGGFGGAGGLQGRVNEGGASAAYFNPALLVDAPAGLTFGVLAASEQIGVSLDGRPSTEYAVPSGVANATHADGTALDGVPLPTRVLQNGQPQNGKTSALPARPRQGAGSGHQTFVYEAVGLVLKAFGGRAALGFYGLIPNGNFTNLQSFYADEREQYFSNSLHPELYGDRMTALSLAFGGGVNLTDKLSIGMSTTLSLHAGVTAPTFIANAGELQHLQLNPDAPVNVSLAPHLGVSYRPGKRWHLTGTVHSPQKVELAVNFTFLLPSGVSQGSSFSMVYDYLPWQFAGGLAFDAVQKEKETLTVSGTLVYGKWSDYTDRHGDTPVAAYGWYDTLTPTVGLRYRRKKIGTFFDAQYQPSPIPLQTGRSNYVDNDRLGFDVGANYGFVVFDTPVTVGAQLQTYWLLPRHQTKRATPPSADGQNHTPALVKDELPDDAQVAAQPLPRAQGLQTNNPGWPGFGSEGFVLAGGLYLSVTP